MTLKSFEHRISPRSICIGNLHYCPPYWIRHFECLNFEVRLVFSDPKKSWSTKYRPNQVNICIFVRHPNQVFFQNFFRHIEFINSKFGFVISTRKNAYFKGLIPCAPTHAHTHKRAYMRVPTLSDVS